MWDRQLSRIATDYGLDGPGSNAGGDVFFRPSRPALWLTQPPVKWVLGLSRGQKRPGHGADPHPIQCRGPKKNSAIPLLTLRVFGAHKRGETYLPPQEKSESLSLDPPFTIIVDNLIFFHSADKEAQTVSPTNVLEILLLATCFGLCEKSRDWRCLSFLLFIYHNEKSSTQIFFHVVKKFRPICRSAFRHCFEPDEFCLYPHCQFFLISCYRRNAMNTGFMVDEAVPGQFIV